jgi:hypothetical protein
MEESKRSNVYVIAVTRPLALYYRYYSSFTDEVKDNCHFSASGWNCVTHCQALRSFSMGVNYPFKKKNKKLTVL